MKKLTMLTIALGLMCCSVALADDMKSNGAMSMPTGPSAETKAIAKIFNSSYTWTGDVAAGSMGPDSPAMKSYGKAVGHTMLGGYWYACDVEDRWGEGKNSMTWKGHMLVGYDNNTKGYVGMCIDNTGGSCTYQGQLNGTIFSLETPNEVSIMGQMMKERLTWDWTEPGSIKFTDEHQIGGADWKASETAIMKHGSSTASNHTSSTKAPTSAVKTH